MTFWMPRSSPSSAAEGRPRQGLVKPNLRRGLGAGRLGEWGQRLAELLTGPSCRAHGLPDAVGVERHHSHLVVSEWPESL